MAGNGSTKMNYKVAVFSSSGYVENFLREKLEHEFEHVLFIQATLGMNSVHLATGCNAVCLFVNDTCNEEVLEALAAQGVRCVALRCAGFDRVDLTAAQRLGVTVVRVPTYSPRSVAEAALTMMMAVARNLRTASLKVAVGNYTVDGLVGMQMSGKTFGVIGTGNIGVEFIKLLKGFGGRILAHDLYPNEHAREAGATYVDLETLLKESDVVSLHTPLLPSTRHIMNMKSLKMMKHNSILVNVSRGGLIDTEALIDLLTSGDCGIVGVAMDVYDGEESLFFTDFTQKTSRERMKAWDRQFITLKALPQVLITPHTAFLTEEALDNIGDVTVTNILQVAQGQECPNTVLPRQ